jgi:hypothetical protein
MLDVIRRLGDFSSSLLPVLSIAEYEFGQALSRISLDDMVHRAAFKAPEWAATEVA